MKLNNFVWWSKMDEGFALGIWVYRKPWTVCIYFGRWCLNIHGGEK